MKISELIEELREIKKYEGDIEVVCLHCHRSEEDSDSFETTLDHLEIKNHPTIGKCVRVLI